MKPVGNIKSGGTTGMQRVEIRVRGQVDRDWSDWLGSLEITHTSDGNTVLSGLLRDQSALYGLLSQLSSLGIQLISVSSEKVNKTGMGKEGNMKAEN